MIRCIDASAAQRIGVDWQQVYDAGIRAGWAKVTEGNAARDPAFRAHLTGMTSRGVRAGCYHFCRPSFTSAQTLVADARTEAQSLYDTSEGWGSQSETLPPLIDLESCQAGFRTADLLGWLGEHLDRVSELFGVVPWLYTGSGFVTKYPGFSAAEWLREYPLVIAAYPLPGGKALSWEAAGAREPPQLSPWGRPSGWQFSGGGAGVPGNVVPGFGGAVVDCTLLYVDSLDDMRRIV